MHLTEGRNTGFQKILEALNFNGSPKPLFETAEERTYFAATLYIHPDAISATLGGNGGKIGGNGGNSEAKTVDHQNELKGNVLAVFHAIANCPTATASEISETVGISKRSVERTIKILKDLGYIVRNGSTYGHWVILK